MGFVTGFTGGVTLTLGLAYLTVYTHERNRQAQAAHLRSQSRVLNSLLEPTALPPPQSRAELAREERSTLIETAKDRWNEEIENAVRWVQRTDWTEVRENAEERVIRLLGSQAAEEAAGVVDAVKAKTEDAFATTKDKAVQAEKKAVSSAKEKAAGYRDAAKAKADRAAAETKSGAHQVADSIKSSGGTLNAARGAVREAVSDGIQKGKEVLGKAGAAIGLAEDKFASKVQGESDVEKALRQRFEKSDETKKTVEEALAERYAPPSAKDNTKLRGV